MLRTTEIAPADQPNPPSGEVEWNGAAAVVAVLAAQVYGATLVVAVLSWRSYAGRSWVLAGVGALLLAAGFSGLALDELLLSRSLLIVAACLGMVWLDAITTTDGAPSLLCSSVFGAWISFAIMIPYLSANPYENGGLWAALNQSPAVETVQWMTLVAVLSFGAALIGSRVLLAPVEQWWSRMWVKRLAFVENDGGFTFVGITLVGLAAFAARIVFVGVGYLASGGAPTSISWLDNGLSFFYYIAIYAGNARMLANRRLSGPIMVLDVAALAFDLFSGSKGKFATFLLFPVILVIVFQKRRLAWSIAGGFAAAILAAVFVLYPLLYTYRNELIASPDPSRPNAALMASATGSWSDSYEEKMTAAFLGAGPSEQVIAATSIVFFDVRQDSGELWERLAAFWVPRALWPDKPTLLSGNEIGKASHRLDRRNTDTSVLQTGIGELYIYFGPAGGMAMFLAGVVLRFTDLAVNCFRAPHFLRIGISVYLFREFAQIVTGGYGLALVASLSTTLLLFSTMTLLSFGASIFAPPRTAAGGRPDLTGSPTET